MLSVNEFIIDIGVDFITHITHERNMRKESIYNEMTLT